MKSSTRETMLMPSKNFPDLITEGTRKLILGTFQNGRLLNTIGQVVNSIMKMTENVLLLFHSKTGLVPNRRYMSRYLTHACHGPEFFFAICVHTYMLHAIHRTDGSW